MQKLPLRVEAPGHIPAILSGSKVIADSELTSGELEGSWEIPLRLVVCTGSGGLTPDQPGNRKVAYESSIPKSREPREIFRAKSARRGSGPR